jgi:hypothetical protein
MARKPKLSVVGGQAEAVEETPEPTTYYCQSPTCPGYRLAPSEQFPHPENTCGSIVNAVLGPPRSQLPTAPMVTAAAGLIVETAAAGGSSVTSPIDKQFQAAQDIAESLIGLEHEASEPSDVSSDGLPPPVTDAERAWLDVIETVRALALELNVTERDLCLLLDSGLAVVLSIARCKATVETSPVRAVLQGREKLLGIMRNLREGWEAVAPGVIPGIESASAVFGGDEEKTVYQSIDERIAHTQLCVDAILQGLQQALGDVVAPKSAKAPKTAKSPKPSSPSKPPNTATPIGAVPRRRGRPTNEELAARKAAEKTAKPAKPAKPVKPVKPPEPKLSKDDQNLVSLASYLDRSKATPAIKKLFFGVNPKVVPAVLKAWDASPSQPDKISVLMGWETKTALTFVKWFYEK